MTPPHRAIKGIATLHRLNAVLTPYVVLPTAEAIDVVLCIGASHAQPPWVLAPAS